MVREIYETELNELLELYLHLHETDIPENDAHLADTWKQIAADRNHHIIVNEVDGRIVSSLICVIIPNLTRRVRPYALIENVVTHKLYRGRGLAGECMEYAKQICIHEHCYKMMLLTGSDDESVHRFYKKAGFNSSDKTAYIQWL